MKRVIFAFGLLLIGSISGCIGWGDYMKFPPAPGSPEIWFRQGISEAQKDKDIKGCEESIEKSLGPVVPGDYSYADKASHIVEYCMLAKGYTFLDAEPANGGVRYCSKTYNGSGPACKSFGGNTPTGGNPNTGTLPAHSSYTGELTTSNKDTPQLREVNVLPPEKIKELTDKSWGFSQPVVVPPRTKSKQEGEAK